LQISVQSQLRPFDAHRGPGIAAIEKRDGPRFILERAGGDRQPPLVGNPSRRLGRGVLVDGENLIIQKNGSGLFAQIIARRQRRGKQRL
jgi:hypothetical protein